MRKNIFIVSILILTILSCKNSPIEKEEKKEDPKASQDQGSYSLITKRGGNDLVESLYSELVSKNVDLKKLEDKIDELYTNKNDSTKEFEKYNGKNAEYYRSAVGHMARIEDSLLRKKMKTLIEESNASYKSSIIEHNDLIKLIGERNMTISDLHTVLKIVKTLHLITKYQKDNFPMTKPLEGIIQSQDKIIKLQDTLINK